MTEASLALVTGATGWLGSHLVAELAAGGWRVRATGRGQRPSSLGSSVEYRRADLVEDHLGSLFEGVTHVFHLAGASSTRYGVEEMALVNQLGSERVARCAADAGVRRMLHMSTTAVYGEKVKLPSPVTETAPASPSRDYGRTKLAAENAVAKVEAETGLEVVVARPVSVFGPGNTKLVASAILDAAIERAAGLQELVIGPDSVGLRLVHLDDVIDACIHLATAPGAAGRAFNLTSGVYPSSAELAAAIAGALGMTVAVGEDWEGRLSKEEREEARDSLRRDAPGSERIVFTPERLRFLRRPNVNNVLSIEALAEAGFVPRRSDLADAIADTVNWYVKAGWLPAP